jgi:hypothetical protein
MKRSEIFPKAIEIYGDSHEVMKVYYLSNLQELEKKLNELNVQEHPGEVLAICRKIKAVKNKLFVLNIEKK